MERDERSGRSSLDLFFFFFQEIIGSIGPRETANCSKKVDGLFLQVVFFFVKKGIEETLSKDDDFLLV